MDCYAEYCKSLLHAGYSLVIIGDFNCIYDRDSKLLPVRCLESMETIPSTTTLESKMM